MEKLTTIAEQLKTQTLHERILKDKAEGKQEALKQAVMLYSYFKEEGARIVVAEKMGLLPAEIEVLEKNLLH